MRGLTACAQLAKNNILQQNSMKLTVLVLTAMTKTFQLLGTI